MGMDNHQQHQPDRAFVQVRGVHQPLQHHYPQLELYQWEQEAFGIRSQRELEYEAWGLCHLRLDQQEGDTAY